MANRVDVSKLKVKTATPPPLTKGKKGSRIPLDLLNSMVALIKKGEWASVDITFETRDQAGTASTRFQKALQPLLDGVMVTRRIWGEGKDKNPLGVEVQGPPFHFALGDKDKVQ